MSFSRDIRNARQFVHSNFSSNSGWMQFLHFMLQQWWSTALLCVQLLLFGLLLVVLVRLLRR